MKRVKTLDTVLGLPCAVVVLDIGSGAKPSVFPGHVCFDAYAALASDLEQLGTDFPDLVIALANINNSAKSLKRSGIVGSWLFANKLRVAVSARGDWVFNETIPPDFRPGDPLTRSLRAVVERFSQRRERPVASQEVPRANSELLRSSQIDQGSQRSIDLHLLRARQALEAKRAKTPSGQELRKQLLKNIFYFSLQTSVYFETICRVATGTIRNTEDLDFALRLELAAIHESGQVPRLLDDLAHGRTLPKHLQHIRAWSMTEIEAAYVLGGAFSTAQGDAARHFVKTHTTPTIVPLFQEQLLRGLAEAADIDSSLVMHTFGSFMPESNLI